MATKTESRRSPDIGEQLQKTLEETPGSKGAKEAEKATEASQKTPEVPVKAKRQLPTTKRVPTGKLEGRTIVIYGPPKVGKSTLASEMGNVFFLDTEGGLTDLEVFSEPVSDWQIFLEWCAAIASEPDRYDAVCIDTFDMLALYCTNYTNNKLGIAHESDADWGKGWKMANQEFTRALAKLASLPELGLILIGHSKDVEIKTRNATYNKSVPSLSGQLKDTVINMADLILFCDFEDDEEGERRIIRTKPSRYWDAGERGKVPRLPDTLPLNYQVLRASWYGEKVKA
jgi:hypothetical protein